MPRLPNRAGGDQHHGGRSGVPPAYIRMSVRWICSEPTYVGCLLFS